MFKRAALWHEGVMSANRLAGPSIWLDPQDSGLVWTIDQRRLPHEVRLAALRTAAEAAEAICTMVVRGAPLIGATAAYGLHLAAVRADDRALDRDLRGAAAMLVSTRPTAKDLEWTVARVMARAAEGTTPEDKRRRVLEAATRLVEASAEACRRIGEHGLPLLEAAAQRHPGQPVNVLTHCNAGRLACVDHGTATAPIYLAHARGIPVHVWVDETRPRNQGAALTAWELGQCRVPHTLVVDNAGGHLMQHGRVDLVLVGADRITRRGDAANKIGTYLKALAAFDNGIPFYVCAPESTFDPALADGVTEIPIEERDADEVTHVAGWGEGGPSRVRICPEGTRVANYGFDVTPARLITGIVTERGVARADEASLRALFPEWP
jgi:methylthioribose-1-phosphate isomerase